MNPQDILNPYQIPATIDSQNSLLVMRDRILQIVLNSMSVFGLLAFSVSISFLIKRGAWLQIAVFSGMLVAVVLLTFFRTLNLSLRTPITLAIFYVVGLAILLDSGLAGTGRFFLIALPLMAAAMSGIFAGIACSVLGTITLLGSGLILTGGVLPNGVLPIVSPAGQSYSAWAISALVYIGLMMLSTPAVFLMIRGLENAASSQQTLTKELTDERDSLETRVQERTAELQQRASELEVISSLAHEISVSENLGDLLEKSIGLLAQRDNIARIAIYLIDQRREFATCRAARSLSQKDLGYPESQRLNINDAGLINEVVKSGEVRILSAEENLPSSISSKTEIILPLISAGETLGWIDLHSDLADAFSPQEVRLLKNLADQLSVGIQRADLVEKLQSHLSEVEQNYKSFTRETWRSHLVNTQKKYAYRYHDEKIDAIPEEGPAAIHLTAENETRVIRQETDPQTGLVYTIVAVPIQLRQQTLGYMEVRFSTPSVSESTIQLLEAAMSRLSLALENARLMEAIQIRADREHMVSEITSKVRASTNIDGILRTTAVELGRSLGVSGVKVQLRPSGKNQTSSLQ